MSHYSGRSDGRFIKWAAANGLLTTPFSMVDVGCREGIHPRWRHFGDLLAGGGFDLNPDDIDHLTRENVLPFYRYYNFALGDRDGAATVYEREYGHSSSIRKDASVLRERPISVSRLDTLVRQKYFPTPNFIKIDTEGTELDVLGGASEILASPYLLGVECETTCVRSEQFPRSHFFALFEFLSQYGFEVYEIAGHQNSDPCIPCRLTIAEGQLAAKSYGANTAFDVVFMRVPETPTLPADEFGVLAIKAACLLNAYDYNDRAYRLLERLKPAFGASFELETALNKLTPPIANNEVSNAEYRELAALLAKGTKIEVKP